MSHGGGTNGFSRNRQKAKFERELKLVQAKLLAARSGGRITPEAGQQREAFVLPPTQVEAPATTFSVTSIVATTPTTRLPPPASDPVLPPKIRKSTSIYVRMTMAQGRRVHHTFCPSPLTHPHKHNTHFLLFFAHIDVYSRVGGAHTWRASLISM